MTYLTKFIVSLSILISTVASANPYNNIPKTITFIMPYGPGSIVDTQYRSFQKYMETKGITVIGLYKPGASSVIASNELLSGPRDGSVLIMNATSNSWLAEHKLGKKVVEPIMSTGGTGIAMITYTGSKYENFDNLISAIKDGDPNIKVGWQGVGNILSMHQLSEKADSKKEVIMVPYKSSVDSGKDVYGKHIPLALMPLNTAKSLADSGNVKIVFGFGPGNIMPGDVLDIKKRFPNWKHSELFFIGIAPGTDEAIVKSWSIILKDWLDLKETEEYFRKIYFGKDVGGPKYVQEVIEYQGASLKRYNLLDK